MQMFIADNRTSCQTAAAYLPQEGTAKPTASRCQELGAAACRAAVAQAPTTSTVQLQNAGIALHLFTLQGAAAMPALLLLCTHCLDTPTLKKTNWLQGILFSFKQCLVREPMTSPTYWHCFG